MDKTPRPESFLGISILMPGSKALYERPIMMIVFSFTFSNISFPRFFIADMNSFCDFSAFKTASFTAFIEILNGWNTLCISFKNCFSPNSKLTTGLRTLTPLSLNIRFAKYGMVCTYGQARPRMEPLSAFRFIKLGIKIVSTPLSIKSFICP